MLWLLFCSSFSPKKKSPILLVSAGARPLLVSLKTSPTLSVNAVAPFLFLFLTEKDKPNFASLCWAPSCFPTKDTPFRQPITEKTSPTLFLNAVALSLSFLPPEN